jgi:hypothetical protein
MMKFVIWFAHVTAALTGFVIASGIGMAVRRRGSGGSTACSAKVCDFIRGRYGGKEKGECWLHSLFDKSLLTRHDLRCARYSGDII